ncbi:MAG: hypothetical protein CM1200mP41_28940 [Gammaproteobacteria bacterium]|nr:MAG: hypothetical protein CM1200mP41_28940 [Gammaproteobacteria bacterium]
MDVLLINALTALFLSADAVCDSILHSPEYSAPGEVRTLDYLVGKFVMPFDVSSLTQQATTILNR